MDNRKLLEEYLGEDAQSLFADGFDDAIIGISVGTASRDVIIYDYDKCIDILMQKHDMIHEDAVDYLEYNTVDAYVGEFTPIFVKTCKSLHELN